jgi:hypothetical protein
MRIIETPLYAWQVSPLLVDNCPYKTCVILLPKGPLIKKSLRKL